MPLPRPAEDIVHLVGNTPMVRLNKVTAGLKPRVYAKLESFNPGGSIKDRIGLEMILDAERSGLIRPGGTIVEPTSGNTGMGLALAAVLRGYKIIFTVPDKMSSDKIDLLRAVGAKVRVTPSGLPPDHPAGYMELAKRLTKATPGAFMPNQYENLANPRAHYLTTGPEIWEQTDGKLDVLVAGVGTGGTISGTGRYLKEKDPRVRVVGVDPEGSILSSLFAGAEGEARSYRIEGIGEDFLPKTLDMSVIDSFVTVSDREALLMTRRLAKEEGIVAGTSSGAAAHGALQVAKSMKASETLVVIFPDTGRSYLNKVYNDDWMAEHDFLPSKKLKVAVKSLLRPARPVPKVSSKDTLKEAVRSMSRSGLSFAPVLESGVQVGSLSAMGLMKSLQKGKPGARVEDFMDPPLPTVEESGTLALPSASLATRGAILVTSRGRPRGIITAMEVNAHLAGQ